MPGTLFVVATPIGNLEDITLRALRVLGEVDLIAAEDTRRTSKLLAHYKIRKSLVSLREHNEARESERLVGQMAAGKSVALVSDAGTPAIADPGVRLVRLAHERGLPVVPIPGPSSVVAALSVSGQSANTFVFLGFPPRSGERRSEWLRDLKDESRTLVILEAPHRIERLLPDIERELVKRPIIVLRELTKVNETIRIRSNNTDDSFGIKPVGEFVVIVGPGQIVSQPDDHELDKSIVTIFGCITEKCALSDEVAIRMVAGGLGSKPSHVRNVVRRHRISVKQQNSAAGRTGPS